MRVKSGEEISNTKETEETVIKEERKWLEKSSIIARQH